GKVTEAAITETAKTNYQYQYQRRRIFSISLAANCQHDRQRTNRKTRSLHNFLQRVSSGNLRNPALDGGCYPTFVTESTYLLSSEHKTSLAANRSSVFSSEIASVPNCQLNGN